MKSGIVFLASLQGYWAVVGIKVICRTGDLKSVTSHHEVAPASACVGPRQH